MEQSVDSLAKYLVGPARNDREKVRAIFRWITDRIAYDVEAYFGQRRRDVSVAGVLQSRKAVCAGYANLFEALCTSAGLEAVVVIGDVKAFDSVPGDDAGTEMHAWNAIKLDGTWHLLDVTWASGIVVGKGFTKSLNESYYLPAPEQMILDHLPTDPAWQLLQPPVSAEDFTKLLKLERGMRPLAPLRQELVEKLREQAFRGFVTLIDVGERYAVRKAPVAKHIRASSRHRFQIESSAFVAVAVLTGGQYCPLTRNGPIFEGEVTLEKGMVLVCVKMASQWKDAYWPVLEYVAE